MLFNPGTSHMPVEDRIKSGKRLIWIAVISSMHFLMSGSGVHSAASLKNSSRAFMALEDSNTRTGRLGASLFRGEPNAPSIGDDILCGPCRTRTGYLIHAMDALYQVS